jgi:hypothetical protein
MNIKRREFLSSVFASGVAVPARAQDGQSHQPLDGPLASATVSLGLSGTGSLIGAPAVVASTDRGWS